MADIWTKEKRSTVMKKIRSRDTKPEMLIRRALHARGLRYRLSPSDLPGKPDIVFRPIKLVVFVHGCFWHQHAGCIDGRIPRSNSAYWEPKLERTKNRDREAVRNLKADGWSVISVWECEIEKDIDQSVAEITNAVAMLAGDAG